MSHPESPSMSPLSPALPIARFSAIQRRRIQAWARRRPHWEVTFDTYTADHLDPGAHPSEAVQINLPPYLSDGMRQSNGWTLWPSLDGNRVGVSFDGTNGALVVTLAEALSDIAGLRVYETTKEDDEEAAATVPMFYSPMPSEQPKGDTRTKPFGESLDGLMGLPARVVAGNLPDALRGVSESASGHV